MLIVHDLMVISGLSTITTNLGFLFLPISCEKDCITPGPEIVMQGWRRDTRV
jgi:hypothetical protein